MSSTNKTTNLKLNKWIGTDRSAREDFNNDNDLIDKFAGEVAESLKDLRNEVTQLSNPNLLINGDFQVWQRGTSFTTNGYTADRWIYDVEGDDKGQITRHANGGVQIKLISNKRFWFHQRIELNQELRNILSNNTVTLSFYVTTSDGAKINPYIRVWSPSKSANIFLKSYEANATRQLIECQMTLGDLSSDEWIGIDCFRIEDDNKFTVGDNLYIRFEYVKLELGSVATPFVPRQFGEELALCKRYFQKIRFLREAYSPSTIPIGINFPVPMRVRPTVYISSYGNPPNNTIDRFGIGEVSLRGSVSYNINESSVYDMGVSEGNFTKGHLYGGILKLDAEIY